MLVNMEISTYEEWNKEEIEDLRRLAKTHPDVVQYSLDQYPDFDRQRAKLLVRFPYAVVATGFYYEHDYACRWCWQNISPEDGNCSAWQSEYPACPLVLATEYTAQGTWMDKNGKILPWERKRYTNPGNHVHEGQWSFFWLGKTDYDYGYGEYYFRDESDRENFLVALSTFQTGKD